MSEGALEGYRVLDLTRYVAGPYTTRLLAGLGAEVIKIEKPGEGDGARRIGPFWKDCPHPERSLLFFHLNAAKKSITLNLKSEAGVTLFKKLVKNADILVENFEPRVMPNLGLSYEVLAEINPRLVMTSISNFGQTGPYRDYKASELVEYAVSGLMYITGEPGREPLRLGAKAAQYVAGQYGFVLTLGALWNREVTELGQQVDVSIMECNTGTLEFQLLQYFYTGYIPVRIGNANEKGHPWGVYPCRNGYVAIAPPPDKWPAMAELMDKPELRDPRFEDRFARIQLRDEIDAIILPWLVEHEKEEICRQAQALGIASGWVRSTAEVANCPQLQAREFYVKLDHPEMGEVTAPGAPYKLSETPWQARRAPLLGEHNEEVYTTYLGYSREDLVRLREMGVI